ncbi:hypothetical protein FB597_1093 [Herbaspirillum sp. SJZ099]|nr:hypothetical protein FB597_1093 [Herbaspirillum sp. SJZ099]
MNGKQAMKMTGRQMLPLVRNAVLKTLKQIEPANH